MRKEDIKKALLDGAKLAYNMVDVKHELYYNDDIFTVRCDTVLKLKDELDLVSVKQDTHNRYKTDVLTIRKNSIEVVELNEQVQQINENTFKYKGSKILMYGEASESNNMAVEGWLILEGGNYEEELSEIYAEGYNTYKEAIKAVYDDLEKRAYPHKIQIEEISFI